MPSAIRHLCREASLRVASASEFARRRHKSAAWRSVCTTGRVSTSRRPHQPAASASSGAGGRAGDRNQRRRVPAELEHPARERPADGDRGQRGEQAGERADAEQLGALHLREQPAARAERAHHGELARARLARRAHRGEQHDQAGGEREGEQELDRAHDLVEDALHLRDRGRDVDRGDVREVAAERVVEPWRLRRAVGGDVADRRVGDAAVGKRTKKLTRIDDQSTLRRLVILPSTWRAAHVEAQRVAELQAERLGQAFLDAEGACFVVLPAARGDRVVRRQGRRCG